MDESTCGCGCGCGGETCGCGGGYDLDPRAAEFMEAIAAAWEQVRTPIDGGDVCITCSDEGRPGVVLDDGRVRTDAGDEDVDLTLTPGVRPGDRVLVHAGMAITALEPEGEPA